MLDRFVKEIAQNKLCVKEDRILLAISGGVDSMVMLHLFHSDGYAIAVAHCNFQLRDSESDDDEKFVKDQCDQLNIPVYVKRFDTNNYAVDNGLSIQMAARDLRYQWFNELANKQDCGLIATAHHLNDNLETTLLNFIRGTGIDGLKGIPLRSGRVIRPLLGFTSMEIIEYAKANGILWREDSSNKTNDYDRNTLRHEVIPKLKELNPSLESGFKNSNLRLRGIHALVQTGLDELRSKFITTDNDQVKISKQILSTPFPETIIWELIKEYGFNFMQCNEIVQASGTSGKQFISVNHKLTIDRDVLIISKTQKPLPEALIHKNDAHVSLGKVELSIGKVDRGVLEGDSKIALIDGGKLSFPLVWRKWKAGDSFYPLGMNNQKKLSDFFIDSKISVADKDTATVIEASGEIIWVVGYRIDNRYKVSDQTNDVIQFKVQSEYI